MHDLRPHRRLAIAALACAGAAGCSMLRHDAKPATVAAPVAAPAARASVAAPPPAPMPAPVAASAASSGLVAVHLDPEAMVGHTWVFPSASPMLYGDNRFVFKRDRVEASNAREHAIGSWAIERDKLCVTLNISTSGSACYYVTGTPPGDLQIRVLPDGDRVPLKIQ
ncbi:hypothetical protein [Scleromatobacter humisilvae]|uniref:Uncharacterized protein n=1 Tax=Scleromatobacter humisilvae TaxID=2897159 RepID=A0A9X1YJM1_9BURK|nr:hypothetical protein [Scleromatobacter humisilvae]MCK9687368.1 hypothetical protein [Scleromatobacter humisilvae]